MNLHAWQDWLKLASLAQEKNLPCIGKFGIVYASKFDAGTPVHIIGHVRRK